MALVLSGSIDISGSMTATTIIVSAPGAAGMVSSSQQIQNYNVFAQTSSANIFYGNQTISGSVFITGSMGFGTNTPIGKVHILADGANGATDLQTAYDNSILRITPQNGSSMGLSVGYAGANLTYIQTCYSNGTASPLRINPFGGNIKTAGNLEFESGAGIDFSATANSGSSTTSELLNDYEEGTWTPIIGGSGGESGQSYTHQKGQYVKVGRMVLCTFDVALSTKGTITSAIQLKGFPYSRNTNSNFNYPRASIGWENSVGSYIQMQIELNSVGNGEIKANTAASTGLTGTIATADINNDFRLFGSISYITF